MKDLIPRLLTGAVFLTVMIGCILMGRNAMLVLFGLITVIGTWEYMRMVKPDGSVAERVLLSIPVVLIYFVLSAHMLKGIASTTVLLLPCLLLLIVGLDYLRSVPTQLPFRIFHGLFLLSLPFGIITLSSKFIRPEAILALFAMVWVNDSFAYLSGRVFGKHKLNERLSPKKTWEGFFGGLIMTLLFALVLSWPLSGEGFYVGKSHDLSPLVMACLGITVSVFATLGDLMESALKRNAGVKDAGSFMPGHGGILDRFDGFLLTIPALFIGWSFFIRLI